MIVRDLTLPKTDYKGRFTVAVFRDCPCRPCYNAHDCGHLNSQGKWIMNMHCATNWNAGCPPVDRQPVHIYTPRGRKCKRCGEYRPKEVKYAKPL